MRQFALFSVFEKRKVIHAEDSLILEWTRLMNKNYKDHLEEGFSYHAHVTEEQGVIKPLFWDIDLMVNFIESKHVQMNLTQELKPFFFKEFPIFYYDTAVSSRVKYFDFPRQDKVKLNEFNLMFEDYEDAGWFAKDLENISEVFVVVAMEPMRLSYEELVHSWAVASEFPYYTEKNQVWKRIPGKGRMMIDVFDNSETAEYLFSGLKYKWFRKNCRWFYSRKLDEIEQELKQVYMTTYNTTGILPKNWKEEFKDK